MRVVTITCDACSQEVAVIHQSGLIAGEYCSSACVRKAEGKDDVEEDCAHEDNISDQVPGRSTARLVCKACGFDRTVEVA